MRCTDPLHAAMIQDSDSSVRVVADEESAIYLEGDNVTFTCPPGLVLTGPSTYIEMSGEWRMGTRPTHYTSYLQRCLLLILARL